MPNPLKERFAMLAHGASRLDRPFRVSAFHAAASEISLTQRGPEIND